MNVLFWSASVDANFAPNQQTIILHVDMIQCFTDCIKKQHNCLALDQTNVPKRMFQNDTIILKTRDYGVSILHPTGFNLVIPTV